MAGKLEGKVAVVTGGTSGTGLATAQRFVAEIGPNSFPVQGDVAQLADLDRLYATVEREKGKIDILFANAGSGSFAPLGSITEEQFDQTFNLNVRGLLFSVQKALPLFRDGGSIILNASVASFKGMEAFSVYSASKAAVRSFARTWSTDLKGRIRVNVVSPGIIPTPAYSNVLGMSQEQIDHFTATGTANIPLGRPGSPDEIAKTVVFLASDDSSYVTGVELFVDGGLAQI